MGKFSVVSLMVLDNHTDTASNCGFSGDSKSLLKLCFPGLPCSVFEREDVIKMMYECDNKTGTLYVNEPGEGESLYADSTLDKLLESMGK